jgi:putative transcriptional regulator
MRHSRNELLGLCVMAGDRWIKVSFTKSVHASAPEPQEASMMRVRLKADGRLVEILADGSERAMPPVPPEADARILAPSIQPGRPPEADAGYARRIRSQTRLTQAEFAARIGVPIETVRNWEQGKRHPRGPARALLKLLDQAPDVAFSVLGRRSA